VSRLSKVLLAHLLSCAALWPFLVVVHMYAAETHSPGRSRETVSAHANARVAMEFRADTNPRLTIAVQYSIPLETGSPRAEPNLQPQLRAVARSGSPSPVTALFDEATPRAMCSVRMRRVGVLLGAGAQPRGGPHAGAAAALHGRQPHLQCADSAVDARLLCALRHLCHGAPPPPPRWTFGEHGERGGGRERGGGGRWSGQATVCCELDD
jgi:hypothetical protein